MQVGGWEFATILPIIVKKSASHQLYYAKALYTGGIWSTEKRAKIQMWELL